MHEVVIADNTKDLCELTDGVGGMRLVEAAEMASAKRVWISR